MAHQHSPVLEVSDLTIVSDADGTELVTRASLDVLPGECVGLIGESGSGKTLTARGAAGLLPRGVHARAGSVTVLGQDLSTLGRSERRELLGREVGLMFQDPMGSLNPVMRVGRQVTEGMRTLDGVGRRAARGRAMELLEAVDISDVDWCYGAYPHELSGGMRQRVMLAIALAMNASLIVADEPTTALDVTTASHVLALLTRLSDERQLAVLLVSHDVRVVREFTERTFVMYAGQVVESGPTGEIVKQPAHPYTQALLKSVPAVDRRQARLPTIRRGESDGRTERGCRFRPRCPEAFEECTAPPLLEETSSGRCVRCFLYSRAP